MPTYLYTFEDDPDGAAVEQTMTIAEMERFEKKPLIDGRRVNRRIDLEHRGHRHACGNWPMLSEAAGVHPDQVKEATEAARAFGVPTEFTRDGRAVFTDRNHRKRYLRTQGLHDKNGGYGD